MALSRGGFENQFPGINPYSAGRKPQDVSPGGSSRNPIGSGFSNNTEGSKMGFFGGMKKDGESADSADFFYGGNKTSLLQRSQSTSDGGLSSHMNNLNLYGSNNSLNSMNSGFKGKENDTSSSNWSSGGWGQSGSGSGSLPFPQGGLGSTNLTNPTSRPSLNSNSLLQFSRSFSLQTGTTSQSSSDMQYQQQLKLLGSGQSSPNNSGLLSTQQQQHMQQSQQQQAFSQRNPIGQMPNISMQGHSSPSHSPIPSIGSGVTSNNNKILPPSRSLSSSGMLPTSSTALSNPGNYHGFIGNQLSRNVAGPVGQNLLSSVGQSVNADMLGPPGSNNGTGIHLNAFDSDFPALANRAGGPNSARNGQNSFSFAISNKTNPLETSQEFQMQNEDFPALPGSNVPIGQSAESAVNAAIGSIGPLPTQQTTTNQPSSGDGKDNALSEAYSLGSSYEQILKDGKFLTEKKGSRTPVSGIQTNSSGVITNIPSGMVTDQFGMIGLLTFIRAAETEPNLVTLALGSDLTTLGLNLNSTESLYHTFGSPFSDSTCKPHEIDFYAPPEYLISSYIRDKLAPIKLGRYGEDLLFYLYYTNCGDILQLAAAAELYARDWRYHKDERVWITRFPGMDPQVKMSTYERGTYYYFDPQGWRKVAKEFHVEYERLEEKPTVQALQQQAAAQQQH